MTTPLKAHALIERLKQALYDRYILQVVSGDAAKPNKQVESDLVRRTKESLSANIQPEVSTKLNLVERSQNKKEPFHKAKVVTAIVSHDSVQEKANGLNKLLAELFTSIRTSPELNFGFFKSNPLLMSIPITDCLGNVYKGVTSMKINTLQGVLAGRIALSTDDGRSVPVEGVPIWNCDDYTVINVYMDADGLSAKLESTGKPGTANITVYANGLTSNITIDVEEVVPVPPPIITPPPASLVATVINIPVSQPYLLSQGSPQVASLPTEPSGDAPVTFNTDGSIAH